MSAARLFFDGLVQRDEDTPQHVLDTCYACYKGSKSAMLRFWKGEPVKAGALAREANSAIAEGVEDDRLRDLATWARQREAISRAAQDLKEAHELFKHAVEGVSLDAYTVEQMRRQACGSAP